MGGRNQAGRPATLEEHTEKKEVKLVEKEEKTEAKVFEKQAERIVVEKPKAESSKPRKWPFSKLKSVGSCNSAKKESEGADENRPQICEGGERLSVVVQADAELRERAGDLLGGCSERRGSTGDWRRPSQARRETGWSLQDTRAYWRERS